MGIFSASKGRWVIHATNLAWDDTGTYQYKTSLVVFARRGLDEGVGYAARTRLSGAARPVATLAMGRVGQPGPARADGFLGASQPGELRIQHRHGLGRARQLRVRAFPPRAPMPRICSAVLLNRKGVWVIGVSWGTTIDPVVGAHKQGKSGGSAKIERMKRRWFPPRWDRHAERPRQRTPLPPAIGQARS